jgi:hypothetical protein
VKISFAGELHGVKISFAGELVVGKAVRGWLVSEAFT